MDRLTSTLDAELVLRCQEGMREQYPYAGMNPLDSLYVQTKAPLEEPVWRDAQQGALPHTVEQNGEEYLYAVHLPQPIFRGETVDLRLSARTDEFITREGDQWIFQTGWTWGRPRKPSLTMNPPWPDPVKQTVAVPAGAVVESVTPAPSMSWVDHDGRYLFSISRKARNRRGSAPANPLPRRPNCGRHKSGSCIT